MSMQIWIPLLFLAIGIFHAIVAGREYQRASTIDTPVFKAKSRVAGVFILVALLLLFVL
ncbi:MAG: hypothetical protein PVI97_18395 [Candidatus Thiodiazotropha sp.]|jgi:hypothetical protein